MEEPQTLVLSGNRQLVIQRGQAADVLEIVEQDGGITLTVHLTPEGPVLHFSGSVALETSGDLGLSARRVAIHARDGLAISSGGDVHVEAAGDLHSSARIQHITAELGNVNVKANDDVKLNGERVMVNC